MTQVNLVDLSKTYKSSQAAALKNLSLELAAGQITALLGPSGCGKTTALKIIAGLLHPDQGDVRFDGHSVLDVPAEQREAVMVFQNHLLFPYLSVGENVGFGLKMRKTDRKTIQRRVAQMLELVQLSGYEDRRPRQLSGGQQQRVALARALIVQPRVLLLDEPLSNLDAHLRSEMRDLILDIQRQLEITTIFVTHDQEEAITLADKIALIFDGQVHQFGRPPDFFNRPASVKVARFFGGSNFLPGVKQGGQVETPLGVFRCTDIDHIPDGPVTLTIRPEHLQVRNSGDKRNVVQAVVQDCLYLGPNARFRVQATCPISQAPIRLDVMTPTAQLAQFGAGQRVTLYFPPDNIWVTSPKTD